MLSIISGVFPLTGAFSVESHIPLVVLSLRSRTFLMELSICHNVGLKNVGLNTGK